MIPTSTTRFLIIMGLAVLMPTIFGNISKTARQSIFSQLLPSRDSFTTISITSLRGCRRLCETVTSCVLINYRSRGHICKLEHYVGTVNIYVSEVNMPGYASWMRKPFNVSTNATDQCPNCNGTQSCVANSDTVECGTFACSNPNNQGTMDVLGNINTVGAKFMCNSNNNIRTVYFLTCLEGGVWSGLEAVDGYEEYAVDGKSFRLKIVEKKVNKTEAFQTCLYDGAYLSSLLTWNKLEFFRGIPNKLPGDFWIDLERKGNVSTVWVSSDGIEHDIDTNLWEEYTDPEKSCARAFERRNWRISNTKCYKTYYYICEIPQN